MVARGRRVWKSKTDLLTGGFAVEALRYQRASADKKHKAKSVEDQDAGNLKEIESHGWRPGESFTDNASPASRHSKKKEREDFERLIKAIESGRGDVLVMWALNRSNRDLAVYVAIRDMCMRVGLFFWMIDGALYDLRDKNDRMTLGMQAVQGEYQADSIQDDVRRGVAGAAARGLPHGKSAFGYRRTYDKSRAFLAEEFDTEVRTAVAADGSTSTYTRADVVREIMSRIVAAHPITRIVDDLNGRGIPSPMGTTWARNTVRKIATNPYYIGRRNYNGEVIDAAWDALVEPDLYWSCVRILRDPVRTTTRPARGRYLLSYLMHCGECGAPVQAKNKSRTRDQYSEYFCQRRRCVAVYLSALDDYVQSVLVEWLSRKDVYELLAQASPTTDEQVAAARAEAKEIGEELADWERAAKDRKVKAADYFRITEDLKAKLEDAESRASNAPVPPLLRSLIGPKARRRWSELGDNIPVKREVIRMLTDITLLPVEREPGVPLKDTRVPLSEQVRFGGMVGAVVDRRD